MLYGFYGILVILYIVYCTTMLNTEVETNLQKKTTHTEHQGVVNDPQKQSAPHDIFCGGILNKFSTGIQSNDTDIQSIVKFTLEYAVKHHPRTISRDDDGHPRTPDVHHPRKLKLQYTEDNKTPFIYQEESVVNGHVQIQRRKSIVGITYFLTLTWNAVPAAYQHNFIVRKDRKHQLYIHGHTFYQPTKDLRTVAQYAGTLNKLEQISHAVPMFVPVSPVAFDSQSQCVQDSHMTANGQSQCLEPQENVWKESAQQRVAESGEETLYVNSSVNLVSYNIWNFNSVVKNPSGKFYNARIDHLGQVVSVSQADIIGFQEVRFDGSQLTELGPSQVIHLAEHLPNYQYVYQPGMTYQSMVQEGLALFSKHPILSHDFILLPKDEKDADDNHQRICLHAEIETPSLGVLHVFVTHLSLSQVPREKSVVAIWKYMSQHSGPAVLLGDLNTQSNSREYRFLTGEEELQGIKTDGLIDAWTVFHREPRPDAPGMYKQDEERDYGLTFSALEEHLRSRIDFIFVRLPQDIKLASVSILDDGSRYHNAPSDHLGLQTSLKHLSE